MQARVDELPVSVVSAKEARRRMVDTVLAVRPDGFQTRKSAKDFVNYMIAQAKKDRGGSAATYSFQFTYDRDEDEVRMFVCVADICDQYEDGGFLWTNATIGV